MKKTAILIFVSISLVILFSCTRQNAGNNANILQDQIIDRQSPDIFGTWHSDDLVSEKIEFHNDRTFLMTSLKDQEETSLSGIFEQDGTCLLLYFIEEDVITDTSVFLVFPSNHEEYRTLYLMLPDGSFLKYRQPSDLTADPMLKPEGVYGYSYRWDEQQAIWAILDIDSGTMSVAGTGDENFLKTYDIWIDGNRLYYPDGCYEFEIFRFEEAEYLFATENNSQSTFCRSPQFQGNSFEEMFPEDDFSFLDNASTESNDLDPICGVWEYEIETVHEHDDDHHEVSMTDFLVFKEDGTFERRTVISDADETEVSSYEGTYRRDGEMLFLESEEQGNTLQYVFIRQKSDHKVMYIMNMNGSFDFFRQGKKGLPDSDPIMEGEYQSAPDWEERDGEFFLVDLNEGKVYIYTLDYSAPEPEIYVPDYILDVRQEGNHIWFTDVEGMDMEGEFDVFFFETTEYAFGVFTNGFRMTIWKELESVEPDL